MLHESNLTQSIHSAPALTVALVTGHAVPADVIDFTNALDSISPFSRALWWESWWRHLRPSGSELFLLTVSQGNKLLGVAPWYTRREFGFGRVVRFMGDGRACSDYMTIAAAPEHHAHVWRAMTNWVAAEAGRSWDTFILSGVSADDERLQPFCQQFQEQDILVDQRTIANTWRVSLPESWEAYVEQFSKQHRNRLRRTKREMYDSGRAILHRASSQAGFDRGFEIQRQLHQTRRIGKGDCGLFADPRFESFLREANQRFLEHGKLRLQWTEVDGEPVAFDSAYVGQEGVFAYQTGFDPTKADLSPGRLHFQASLNKAIEEGYRFYDFLRGDEPYKAHFRATPIALLETRLIAPKALPRLGHQLWKLQKQVKARVRSTVKRKAPLSVFSLVDEESALSVTEVESRSAALFARAVWPQENHCDSAREAPPSTPHRDAASDRRGIDACSSVKAIAYRAACRLSRVKVAHVLALDLAELVPPPSVRASFEYRWLTADEVRIHANDPANDLSAELASRLVCGKNLCFASFEGPRLVNYCWYAFNAIEPEHSLGAGLSFPKHTAYLYKAFTHPNYRGRGIHHSAVCEAAPYFVERGISRLIAIVEYANWPSIHGHTKLGFRQVGRMLLGGRPPLRVERFPQLANTLEIRFGSER